MVMYTAGLFIGKDTNLVEPQSDVLKAGVLTDEAIRNGSLKKNTKKRGNGGEPSRDGNVRDDKKRSRTRRAFATTTNLVRKEYTGTTPKCKNYNYHHLPETPCRTCANCNRFGHFAKDYRVGPRMVNLLNARNPIAARGACFECGGTDHYKEACPRLNRSPGQGGNRPNQVLAVDGGQGLGSNGNQALGRAFILGIEGHTFDIDLIPFGHESFDVIIGLDWLSRHKAEIVCHEKVVRIPLPNDEMLRVLGERPKEKVRHLMSAKAEEQKLKVIIVVRNFSEVFPDDLSGLPPS
ncbi:reverse transcriptase domain-containing protein [Tanacetum coccineum]